ncbi:MAG: Fe(3+) ABC transporter substrate-binding protein [Bacteroidota bacterium]
MLFIAFLAACSTPEEQKEITLYTHRHYDTDKVIFEKFEKETGIKVNVVKASADELIQKMEIEGEQSPADLLITVDAGRLVRAKDKGLLQSIDSEVLNTTVPAHLQDTDKQWFGLTKRARIIAYDKNKVDPATLSTYEALADSMWRNKILIRASSNIYNQSLLASIIANDGQEAATAWADALVANMARVPKGNDRDQVKAILAGEGELAIINTYYLGKLLNSSDSTEVKAGQAVEVFFPNQDGRGAHVNISGIGLAKYAPHKEDAIKFIEYLVSKEVQEEFAQANYEYPVNPNAASSELLESWGPFKEDQLPLSKLGELNKEAVITFDQVQWDKGPDAKEEI